MVHSPPLQKHASRVRTVRPFEEPCKPQLLSDHGRAASDAIGAVRDATGGYTGAFALCMMLQLTAAGAIQMSRPQRKPIDLR